MPCFPLPNMAPAFVFGALSFLLPIAALWWLYFIVNRDRKSDGE